MQIRQLLVPNHVLFNLTQTCRYLNCCCNFFLYSATSSLFRRELREIFQCCFTSNKQQKQYNVEHGATVNRTRTPSSPQPISPTNIDQITAERKKLLSLTTPKKTNDDSFQPLSTTLEEPRKNGHVVSFKT